ncbi:MAG: DegT/DnrJ/EryC1/StrS family aminotransferase [Mariprofundaceae bacterium]
MKTQNAVHELESYLTNYYGGEFCRVYHRASRGLYILLCGLKKRYGGGEVMVPALCCESVLLAVIYSGMTPVIIDVDEDTGCISYVDVEKKLTSKTKSIILVYIFGHLFDIHFYQRLKGLRKDIVIIEDIAQAVGGKYDGVEVGRNFDVTLLSFSSDKIIPGECGALVYNSDNIDASLIDSDFDFRCDRIKNELCLSSLRNYSHALYDLYRMDASIQLSSLWKKMIPYYRNAIIADVPFSVDQETIIEAHIKHDLLSARRYNSYMYYREHINNKAFKLCHFKPGWTCWRASLIADSPELSRRLTMELRNNGLPASNHYFPLNRFITNDELVVAESIYSRIVNLWVDCSMSPSALKESVKIINAC